LAIRVVNCHDMSPPDTTADRLAMLLSTDWFFAHWLVIGLRAGNERRCFQRGCREIVKEFVQDVQDYYSISFSEERVAATRQAMRALAEKCALSSDVSQRLAEFCTPKMNRDEKQTTAWTFTMVLEELSHDEELDSVIRGLLLRVQKQFTFDSEALERSCKLSQTDWDVHIRQLTPEHESTLSDFVSVGLVPEAQLDFVLEQLDEHQCSALREEFRGAASRKTGLRDDQLPDTWR
jgi:hypothetical protein